MVNIPSEFGIVDTSIGPYFDALESLALTEKEYFTACEIFNEHPSTEAYSFLRGKAFRQTISHIVAMRTLSHSMPLVEFLKDSLLLTNLQQHDRAETINALTNAALLTTITGQNIPSERLEDLPVQQQNTCREIGIKVSSNMFTQTLISDTNIFVAHVLKQPLV